MVGELTSLSLAMGRGVVFTGPPPVSTAPSAFTAGQWSVADAATGGTATVTIAALPSDGGSAITAIQYKAGAGAWTNSGIASTGTFNITGLTNGAAVNVLVRAVNAIGNGADSDTKSVTPTAAVTPANEVPFTLAMTEPRVWYSARDTSSILNASGLPAAANDPVYTWKNKTAGVSRTTSEVLDLVIQGATGAAGVAGNAPAYDETGTRQNNIAGVCFNGNDDRLGTPAGTFNIQLPHCIYLVWKCEAANGNYPLSHSGGNFLTLMQVNADGTLDAYTSAGDVGTVVVGEVYITKLKREAQTSTAGYGTLNGSETPGANGASTNTGNARLILGNRYGGNSGQIMTVYELIGFDRAADANPTINRAVERMIEGELAHAYALTAKLPADHPFKTTPPTVPAGTTSVLGYAVDLSTLGAQQTMRGYEVEIADDSLSGGYQQPEFWGLFNDLSPANLDKLINEVFKAGTSVGRATIFRLAGGLFWRGNLSVDGGSGLGNKWGPRGANQRQKFSYVCNAVGAGVNFENWSPPPHFKTTSSVELGTTWAGGSNARSVTLDSIYDVTPGSAYDLQCEAIAQSFVGTLEDLHGHPTYPIRVVAANLQNEASNPAEEHYGTCTWTERTYVHVMKKVAVLIRNSAILATWQGQPNRVLLHGDSMSAPGGGYSGLIRTDTEVLSTGKTLAQELDYWSTHYITAISTDPNYIYDKRLASPAYFADPTRTLGKPVIENEFQHFDAALAQTEAWRTSSLFKIALQFFNWVASPSINLMIHAGKRASDPWAMGQAIVGWRATGEAAITSGPFAGVVEGDYKLNPVTSPAVLAMWKYVAPGAVWRKQYENLHDTAIDVGGVINPDGKAVIFLSNFGTSPKAVYTAIGRSGTKTFKGYRYSSTQNGTEIDTRNVSAIQRTVAAQECEIWVEQ